MNAPARNARSRLFRLVELLWLVPLWAIPFALFFGTLSGSTWTDYREAYRISLVFTGVIRLSLLAVEWFALPPLHASAAPGRHPWVREGVLFTVVSLAASMLAALLVDRFVRPLFLEGAQGLRTTALFSLVFTMLVGGMVYARLFYRLSVERALQVERMRAELAQAELRTLRSQVHPHFLFNTLNTIAALIAEDPRAAEEIVTRLADVFRHSLAAASGEHARFGDEMDFLRAYLAIEHARLGDRLRFVESVEPGLEAVLVPGLLFQPLVENAVRHAAAEREQGGTVTLEARREGGSLRVTISDDGPGFAPAGTPPLRGAPRGSGVGLSSVRERLRLAGAGHGLEIDSSPGRGARITVTLPLEAPRQGGVPAGMAAPPAPW